MPIRHGSASVNPLIFIIPEVLKIMSLTVFIARTCKMYIISKSTIIIFFVLSLFSALEF